MGAGSDWLPVAELCANRFFCILPDLPGHGHNTDLPPAQPLTFERVAREFNQFLQELKLSSVGLVGYSMGGRLALYMAAHQPQTISGLVLESASPGLVGAKERQARATTDDERAAALLAHGINAFVDDWYQMPLFHTLKRRPELLEAVKQRRKQNKAQHVAKVISGLSPGRQPPLWSKLGTLPMPVLLVAGALDSKYAGLMETMERQIPNATLAVVAGAGHNIHLEKPQQFATLIMRFLGQKVSWYESL